MPTPPGDTGGFRRLGEEEVFRAWLFTVGHGRFADPDGHPFDRYVVRHPGAVAVVAVDEHGVATLVRQLRPAVWKAVLEIPAGTCDVAGEPPEDTARRELAEEAGLEADEWRRLAAVHNSPGFSDQLTTIYLATGLRPCRTDRAGVEEHWMTTEPVALADVEELVAAGHLVDETSILGLLLARATLAGAVAGPARAGDH
jgi:ADP-ribose pyrophosphatase